VGWNTVEKRVMEFANSNMGELTVAGFETFAQGLEEEKVCVCLCVCVCVGGWVCVGGGGWGGGGVAWCKTTIFW